MEKIKLAAVALVCGAIAMSVLTSGAQEKRVNEKMPIQGIAKGPFDVKIAPIETAHKDVKEIARYSAEKMYHGDLEGSGVGEMLAGMGTVKGSGTYVAIEFVSGTLAGKKGTFVLGHIGTMQGGTQNLSISVVPDSGTGELAGISGKMNIIIAPDGKHSYEFEYKIEKQ